MELAFTAGPGRGWMNLGSRPSTPSARSSDAPGHWSRALLDSRTANLGLHCRVDLSMGNDVLIAIAVKHVPAPAQTSITNTAAMSAYAMR